MLFEAMQPLKGMRLFIKIFAVILVLTLFLFLLYFSAVDDYKREQFIAPAFVPEDNTKELSFLCNETFNRTLEDNLNVIQDYPRGIADDFLWRLGANKTEPSSMKTFPVFATAINKAFYPLSQGFLKSLHQRFLKNPKYGKDVQIIVYDLGLTPRQLKMQLLMEFGFVWWIDSSVRFTTDDIDSAITYAKQNSMLYAISTSDRVELSLTKQTDKTTFEFLREDRCKFRPFGEAWATSVMFHYDRLSRAVVQAWVICALNSNCIAPPGSLKKIICNRKLNYDGRCHRFDQSVLSIVTRRLFHEQNVYPLDKSLYDIYVIQRADFVSYFDSCHPFVNLCLS